MKDSTLRFTFVFVGMGIAVYLVGNRISMPHLWNDVVAIIGMVLIVLGLSRYIVVETNAMLRRRHKDQTLTSIRSQS